MDRNTVQFAVPMRNEPAELRRFASALAGAGVTVLSLSWHPQGDVGMARLVAAQADGVERALEGLGWAAVRTPALSIPVPARAADLARLVRMLEDAGVRLLGMYGASERGETCRMTLCVDRPERAEKLLTPFAEAVLTGSR